MSTVLRTQYGEPLPEIISQAAWKVVSASTNYAAVGGASYRQILCCDRNSIATMWPCDNGGGSVPYLCDPWAKTRIWSPRRSHVALTIQNSTTTRIVVLGQSCLLHPPPSTPSCACVRFRAAGAVQAGARASPTRPYPQACLSGTRTTPSPVTSAFS